MSAFDRVLKKISDHNDEIVAEIEKAAKEAIEQDRALTVLALARAGYKDAAEFVMMMRDK